MKYVRPEIETARLATQLIESRFQKALSYYSTHTSY
jgi:hypothetical protein